VPVVLGASVFRPGRESARRPEGALDAFRPVESMARTQDGLNAFPNQVGNRSPTLRGELAQCRQLIFRHLDLGPYH
jgi:hypothetical protein